MKPNLIVLASGHGSTFSTLVEADQKTLLDMNVKALIVDRDCGAIEVAREKNIPAHIVSYADEPSSFGIRLQGKIEELAPDFIFLAGFLRKISSDTVFAYRNRIFNTHPSLLPEFGGQGMYGRNVHKAVITAGKNQTGVSFHHVTDDYDQGAVIAQRKVRVESNDTVESLEEKVKAVEKFFVIEQLNLIASVFRREI